MVSISAPFPLDQGFLRRECPHCERQFKCQAEPPVEHPADVLAPDVYWCPYCGETAPPDDWWTPEQLDFAVANIAGPAVRSIVDDLAASRGNPSDLMRVSVDYEDGEIPIALHEPSDMVIVQAPCHPWEPIKIIEEWSGQIHCLICGMAFVVD